MVDKKGFVKTLESILGIVLVLSFTLYITNRDNESKPETPAAVKEAQRFILEEVSRNQTFRSCMLSASNGECATVGCTIIADLVNKQTPPGYVNSCEICDKAISCTSVSLPLDKSIYADSAFISAVQSKVLRVYFWEQ